MYFGFRLSLRLGLGLVLGVGLGVVFSVHLGLEIGGGVRVRFWLGPDNDSRQLLAQMKG